MRFLPTSPSLGRCLPSVLAALLVAACAGTSEPVQRADRAMAPGSVVGPQSQQWETPARLLSGKSPAYPIEQFVTGKTGYAEVGFTVAQDGTTRDIEIVDADQAAFGRHLAIAVKDWRFDPATKDGQPVASRLGYSLCFEIERNFMVPRAPRDSKLCGR